MLLDRSDFRPGAVRPSGSLIDPFSNRRNLLRVQLSAHGHAGLIADAGDTLIQSALGRFPRLNRFARLTARKRERFRIQPQPAHLLLRAVATIAGLRENRLDVFREIGLRLQITKQSQSKRTSSKKSSLHLKQGFPLSRFRERP